MSLKDVVGLEENLLKSIEEKLSESAVESASSCSPAMYLLLYFFEATSEPFGSFLLIELLRDLLTSNNSPVGDCCICMEQLSAEDSSNKCLKVCWFFVALALTAFQLRCSHSFHRECLGRWIHGVICEEIGVALNFVVRYSEPSSRSYWRGDVSVLPASSIFKNV